MRTGRYAAAPSSCNTPRGLDPRLGLGRGQQRREHASALDHALDAAVHQQCRHHGDANLLRGVVVQRLQRLERVVAQQRRGGPDRGRAHVRIGVAQARERGLGLPAPDRRDAPQRRRPHRRVGRVREPLQDRDKLRAGLALELIERQQHRRGPAVLQHRQQPRGRVGVEHEVVAVLGRARPDGALEREHVAAPHHRDDHEATRHQHAGDRRHQRHRHARGQQRQRQATGAVGQRLDHRVEQRARAGLDLGAERPVQRLHAGLVHGVLEAVVGELHHRGDRQQRHERQHRRSYAEDRRHDRHAGTHAEARQQARRHADLEHQRDRAGDGVEQREELRQLVLAEARAGDGLELVVADGERGEQHQDEQRQRVDVAVAHHPRWRTLAGVRRRGLGAGESPQLQRQHRDRHHQAHQHEQQLRGADGAHDRARDQADRDHADHARGRDRGKQPPRRAGIVQIVGDGPKLHDEQVRDDLGPDVEAGIDPVDVGADEHVGQQVRHRGHADHDHDQSRALDAVGEARVQQHRDRRRDAVEHEHPRQRRQGVAAQEQRVADRASEHQDGRAAQQVGEQQPRAPPFAGLDAEQLEPLAQQIERQPDAQPADDGPAARARAAQAPPVLPPLLPAPLLLLPPLPPPPLLLPPSLLLPPLSPLLLLPLPPLPSVLATPPRHKPARHDIVASQQLLSSRHQRETSSVSTQAPQLNGPGCGGSPASAGAAQEPCAQGMPSPQPTTASVVLDSATEVAVVPLPPSPTKVGSCGDGW
ncbi:MAG: hypothetical protein U0168_00125 [Nannocystaceae bacterium]